VRISLKVINSELERLHLRTVHARGDGYFYFRGGEAADWLDRTTTDALPQVFRSADGFAAALNEDGSINSAQNPAKLEA
jgi:hypothetical protein